MEAVAPAGPGGVLVRAGAEAGGDEAGADAALEALAPAGSPATEDARGAARGAAPDAEAFCAVGFDWTAGADAGLGPDGAGVWGAAGGAGGEAAGAGAALRAAGEPPEPLFRGFCRTVASVIARAACRAVRRSAPVPDRASAVSPTSARGAGAGPAGWVWTWSGL
jgi:hypothetical protein